MGEPIFSEDLIETIAAVCHEANRAYCMTIGELDQPKWFEAPEWQTRSAIEGVKLLLYNPETGPEACHRAWMEGKARDGWTYGPVKDVVQKTHPCFREWDQLPIEQRRKDLLFCGIVRALSKSLPEALARMYPDGAQG